MRSEKGNGSVESYLPDPVTSKLLKGGIQGSGVRV